MELKSALKMWIVGFIVFASMRYMLPNYILNKPIILKDLLVISTCYGLALIARNELTNNFNL